MLVESVRIDGVTDAMRLQWPFTVPSVAQLYKQPLEFTNPVTILVGENGSGKSTLVEALAEAYGIDVRGGHGARRYGPASLDKGVLGSSLVVNRTLGSYRSRRDRSKGFFLRAETAFEVFNFMSTNQVPGYGDRHLATVSHGEGFLQVFRGRFNEPGLYLMDEPEAALSFTSCLRLVSIIGQLSQHGGQVICATHSPILAAIPGATIYELNGNGIERRDWRELELTEHWSRFMANPDAYLDQLTD